MTWPLSQDYNEAVQNPRTSFDDADLRNAEAVANAMGIPIPRSGNFADVYEFRSNNGGHWAVKCFTREILGLRERYAAISRHLQDANLPFMVDFTFLEQGIRVRGQWYPILKMQWVEGLTLNEFVGQYAEKPVMLEALLQIWVRMAARLRASGIAHADLQHGNVLLVPGSTSNSLAVKLVDYDGMFVPSLAGSKSGEVGHPCYQHPQRLTEGTYSAEVDRFPLLLVATALHAVKVGGRVLWEKHNSGDNLLFREADLRTPVKSPLFYELIKLADERASRLAGQTLDALKARLESVPLLEDVLPELHAAAVAKPVTALATAKRTSTKVFTAQTVLAEQPSAEAAAVDSAFDFEGKEKGRSRRRRRKGGSRSWVKGAVAVIVAGSIVVGSVFVVALRNETEKPKEHKPIAENRPKTLPRRSEKPNEKMEVKEEKPDTNPPQKPDADPPVPNEPKPAEPQGGSNSPPAKAPELPAKPTAPEPAKPVENPPPPPAKPVENPPAPVVSKPPEKPPEVVTAKNDFVPLFNGKDLTGWKPHPDDKTKWEVKDGILIGSGEKGHLYSERGDYENFHLRVEAMINDGGNSGHYFRSAFGPGFPKGYLVQIEAKAGNRQKTGSLSGIAKVTEQLHKPNEWFTQEVIADGDRILVKVNDKTVVDARDSRYKKGHFALQQYDPSTVIQFRKIEVKLDKIEIAAGDTVSPPRVVVALSPEAKAVRMYEKSCAAARKKLLAEFDLVVNLLTKTKGSAEQRLQLIDAIKAEKTRFEQNRSIPWSELMRPSLAKYFDALALAEIKVRRVYEASIDAQLRKKNESKVAELRTELNNLGDVRVVAKWRAFANGGGNGVVVLYSNGKIGRIDSINTWTYANGILKFHWPNPKAPGGTWIDTVRISTDGTTYSGTNQLRKIRLTGIYVKDD